MIRNGLAMVTGLLAVAVLVPTAVVTHTYVVRPQQVDRFGDWFEVLLPLVPPIVALVLGLLLLRRPRRGLIGRCTMWGACAGCAAYMLVQAWGLATQFTLISQDPVAHWAWLLLPTVYVAPPLLFLGLVIGAVSGWLLKNRLPDHGIELTSVPPVAHH